MFGETPFERLMRTARLQQLKEEEEKNKLLSEILQKSQRNTLNSFVLPHPIPLISRRKVFISYHHNDEYEVKGFVKRWSEDNKIFIPKGLGLKMEDDIIDSDSPEYVMSQIRKKHLLDSTVTIVLIGSCTHSRRYVDWEIKTSLRQGLTYTPNGLVGILLPSKGTSGHLPSRFQDNWNNQNYNCYARYYVAPSSGSELRRIIEDAHTARTTRAKHIINSSDMMKYNQKCQVCGFTH